MMTPTDFGPRQKNGGRAEASRQGQFQMLSIAEETPHRKRRNDEHAGTPPVSELESWFRNRVARGANAIFSETVEITPAIAALFLSHNESNRPLSRTNLDRLIVEITGGRWELNGETIIIANDGSLNDGQHRCQAVIEANASIRTMVVFGAARSSRMTTDQGVVRTVGHLAAMSGTENGKLVATVAGFIWYYNQGGFVMNSQGRAIATRTQVLALIEAHPEISDAVKRTASKFPSSRALGAFCRWAIERRAGPNSQAIVDWFFDRFVDGAGLEAGHPILLTRNTLVAKDNRLTLNERASIIMHAWNNYRAGDTNKMVVRPSRGKRAKLPELRR